MSLLKLTAMAVTKFEGLFLNLKSMDISQEENHETRICVMNMSGMMARSASLSAFSWPASFENIRHGVKTITLRFATNF